MAATAVRSQTDSTLRITPVDRNRCLSSPTIDETAWGPAAGFLRLVEPWIDDARRRLLSAIKSLYRAGLPYHASELEAMLYPKLAGQLIHQIGRTVVLELHVARLQGTLAGDTPEDRFRSFIRRLGEPEFASELLSEYPVLARLARQTIDQWRAASAEFAGHLARDWSRLAHCFFATRRPARLASIEGGAGDPHRGGRSVMILTFSDGQRLVYKPRSLAAEARFQRLLSWLNARGATPEFRPLRVVDQQDHGWVEFVPAKSCDSLDAARRFYQRQGGYLAILRMLAATDLHFENLIACGEHPMFVDLEALFHQQLPQPPKCPAATALNQSVVPLRMLPQLAFVEGMGEPIDFSGLGAVAGQETPFVTSAWEHAGADQMQATQVTVAVPEGLHRPRIDGAALALADFEDDLLAGFESIYRLLAGNRHELLDINGPIAAFGDAEVRFIARPTQVYGILLEQGLHPDRLRDGAERESLLSLLDARVRQFPCLARLVDHERDDLNRSDVPVFTSRPASRDLRASSGEVIANFFERSMLEQVRDGIAKFDQADLAQQMWLVRASLALARREVKPASATWIDGDPLTEARRIGDRLADLACVRGEEAGWLGLVERPRWWSIGPLGADLATGATGIALFLAHLGKVTRIERYTELARRGIKGVLLRVSDDEELRQALAGLPEMGQLPRALYHLAQLWNDSALAAATWALELAITPDCGAHSGNLSTNCSVAAGMALLRDACEAQPRCLDLPSGVDMPGARDGLAGRGMELLAKIA
jgi:type 2 lantibiotic biosynthesis protein LanM